MCVAVQTKDLQRNLGLKYEPAAFRDPRLARSLADRCKTPHMVVMGDCPWYWVVCPADASKLVRAGYEILPR